MEKICPFMSWKLNTIAQIHDGLVYCYEQDCAMWDIDHRRCGMKINIG